MSSTNEQAIEGKELTAGCLFTQLPLKHSYFVWNKLQKGEGKTRLSQGCSQPAFKGSGKVSVPQLPFQSRPASQNHSIKQTLWQVGVCRVPW